MSKLAFKAWNFEGLFEPLLPFTQYYKHYQYSTKLHTHTIILSVNIIAAGQYIKCTYSEI